MEAVSWRGSLRAVRQVKGYGYTPSWIHLISYLHTLSTETKVKLLIRGRRVLQGNYGKDTVRPVTIKQILDAQQPHPDADFKCDGEAMNQVCMPPI